MRTVEKVRALFSEGAVLECVENTYRPELNGSRRRIDKLGKTFADCTTLDGPDAGKPGGFYMSLPSRAGDVVELTDDTVTYRLDGPAANDGAEHTVTLRVVG
jgi:hypothetical protein